MAANRGVLSRGRKSAGQSLVEFAFLMPIIFGMITCLRQINMAINASIVNTRYSRSTMMFLFFNSRWYPEESFVEASGRNQFLQRWWVGVGNTPVQNSNTSPVAPTISIAPIGPGGPSGQDDPGSGDEIRTRSQIRIRGMAFICTPPRGLVPSSPYSMGSMPDALANQPGGAFSSDKAPGIYCNVSN